jgi:hypothetical protein
VGNPTVADARLHTLFITPTSQYRYFTWTSVAVCLCCLAFFLLLVDVILKPQGVCWSLCTYLSLNLGCFLASLSLLNTHLSWATCLCSWPACDPHQWQLFIHILCQFEFTTPRYIIPINLIPGSLHSVLFHVVLSELYFPLLHAGPILTTSLQFVEDLLM